MNADAGSLLSTRMLTPLAAGVLCGFDGGAAAAAGDKGSSRVIRCEPRSHRLHRPSSALPASGPGPAARRRRQSRLLRRAHGVLEKGSNPFVANPTPPRYPRAQPAAPAPADGAHPDAFSWLRGAHRVRPFAIARCCSTAAKPVVRLGQKWTVWRGSSVDRIVSAPGGPRGARLGRYGGWDPVRERSFIPWLTATALLHSLNLYVQRASSGVDGRSGHRDLRPDHRGHVGDALGAIQSQHAFQESPCSHPSSSVHGGGPRW